MNDMMVPPREMGDRLRETAAGGISQARKAYDDYSSAAERMISAMEGSFRQAWLGARDLNQRMMSFADQNARLGFEYAEKLATAADANQAMTLQQEYFRVQAERMGHQMRELNDLAARATRDAQDAAKVK